MRIVEVIYNLSSGGAQRLVVDLCNEMSKTEDVTLLTLKNQGFYRDQISDRVKIECLGFKDGFHASYPLKLWSKIRSMHPDVVHIHLCEKYCILTVLLQGKRTRVFQTIHNDVRYAYSRGCRRFLIGVMGRLKLMHSVTISRTNCSDFERMYPGVPNTLIYNGRCRQAKSEAFDEVKSEVERLKQDGRSLVLLHIAVCGEAKNQSLLVDAFNKWIAEGANAILLVIGARFDSDEGKKLQHDSCDRIKYLGTRTNVADYMYCSDAFILSSIYEGMPMTVIEALTTGLPVLSTPVCGVVDLVRNEENGLISPDFSKEQFVNLLNRFAEIHAKLKRTAEQEIETIPTISDCAAGYLALFRKRF